MAAIDSSPDFSVVVPIYDEVETIEALFARLTAVADGLRGSVEFIFVDDGSNDGSAELLDDLTERDPRVVVVHLSRNFGLQPAIAVGLENTKGDAVVVMDGDLQDPPELIPELAERWRDGYDVVHAVRRSRAERGIKRWLISMFYRLLSVTNLEGTLYNAGNFSLIDARAVRTLQEMPERNRYFPALRVWIGFRQSTVEFDRLERHEGHPSQDLKRLVRLGFDALFGFSYAPLRIATAIGVVSAIGALFLTAVVVALKLFTDRAVLGWASIMTAILFLGAVQLIVIGILGEYVGRTHDEVTGRPYYIVDRISRQSDGHSQTRPDDGSS